MLLRSKRLTGDHPPLSLGTFKPTGHIVAALGDDQRAEETVEALKRAGIDAEDVSRYTADEVGERMTELSQHASEFAGFGYEISLMRRWQELAREGCGWLLIYSPEDETTQRVAQVLREQDARLAVKYHLAAIEDIV